MRAFASVNTCVFRDCYTLSWFECLVTLTVLIPPCVLSPSLFLRRRAPPHLRRDQHPGGAGCGVAQHEKRVHVAWHGADRRHHQEAAGEGEGWGGGSACASRLVGGGMSPLVRYFLTLMSLSPHLPRTPHSWTLDAVTRWCHPPIFAAILAGTPASVTWEGRPPLPPRAGPAWLPFTLTPLPPLLLSRPLRRHQRPLPWRVRWG